MIKENVHDVVNGINAFQDTLDITQINHNFSISKTKVIHFPFNYPLKNLQYIFNY
jgi:hypothetical protein